MSVTGKTNDRQLLSHTCRKTRKFNRSYVLIFFNQNQSLMRYSVLLLLSLEQSSITQFLLLQFTSVLPILTSDCRGGEYKVAVFHATTQNTAIFIFQSVHQRHEVYSLTWRSSLRRTTGHCDGHRKCWYEDKISHIRWLFFVTHGDVTLQKCTQATHNAHRRAACLQPRDTGYILEFCPKKSYGYVNNSS
jgi:hypothetical protein